MAKLTRFTQKLFGSTAGTNTMSQFGGLAAGYPVVPTRYSGSTITPTLVQALANYLTGWTGAVIGGNSPAIEDMNSVCYLFAYQLAYLMQEGIAEYDASTTYYISSFCQSGGIVYQSLVDTNTGNTPASSPSQWKQVINGTAPTIQKFTSGSGTYTTPAGVKYIRVKMVGGGGGGRGGGSAGGVTDGGTGGTSTFGTTLLSAGGGSGGDNVSGGLGGAVSLGSGPIGVVIVGGQGSGPTQSATAGVNICGGSGASSPLGGAGGGSLGTVSAPAKNAAANSGSGGAGGGNNSNGNTGGAGGAGGWVEALISPPLATYAYAVGAAGTAGAAGTSGDSGGAGGAGIIIVEEYYQ